MPEVQAVLLEQVVAVHCRLSAPALPLRLVLALPFPPQATALHPALKATVAANCAPLDDS